LDKYEHLVTVGRFGGFSKSDKKKAAARANLVKARKAKQARESFERQDKAIRPKW
jgi:hypothetical protein